MNLHVRVFGNPCHLSDRFCVYAEIILLSNARGYRAHHGLPRSHDLRSGFRCTEVLYSKELGQDISLLIGDDRYGCRILHGAQNIANGMRSRVLEPMEERLEECAWSRCTIQQWKGQEMVLMGRIVNVRPENLTTCLVEDEELLFRISEPSQMQLGNVMLLLGTGHLVSSIGRRFLEAPQGGDTGKLLVVLRAPRTLLHRRSECVQPAGSLLLLPQSLFGTLPDGSRVLIVEFGAF